MDLAGILDRIEGCSVAVAGDFIADEYISGRPVRLSREAPIPIIRHESTRVVPGGAANTVNNLRSLGSRVIPLGVVGDDAMGRQLTDLLSQDGVDIGGLIVDPGCETVTKTRLLAGDLHTVKQQVARVDRDARFQPSKQARAQLLAAVEKAAAEVDVLVVSDYGYRTLSPEAAARIRALTPTVRVCVDSHERLGEFRGAYAAVPNEAEAQALAGLPIRTEAEAIAAGEKIRQDVDLSILLITRGNQGIILFDGTDPRPIPIQGPEDITDVSGAGDTVTAVMALALAAGADAHEAALLANAAAGVVVMKRGTATISPQELRTALEKVAGP